MNILIYLSLGMKLKGNISKIHIPCIAQWLIYKKNPSKMKHRVKLFNVGFDLRPGLCPYQPCTNNSSNLISVY